MRVRFDATRHGVAPALLGPEISLDLAGVRPVVLTRRQTGEYEGDFCLDARALCAQHARLRALAQAGQRSEIAIFEGRELVRREVPRPLDLDALWRGEAVTLTGTGPSAAGIDADRALMIRDRAVIEDPHRTYTPCGKEDATQGWQPAGTELGKWTFGRLVTDLAGQTDAGEFVRDWLLQLDPSTPTTVNGFPVPNRPGVRGSFLVPWCKASSQTAACDKSDAPSLDLDVGKAPFRLLAIVNRIDLADVFAYGSSQPGHAGELRFVFVAEKSGHCDGEVRFFVIFEYTVRKERCADLTQWAKDWIALGTLSGSAYTAKLEALVESVVTKPGALARIRTNEVAFVPSPPSTDPEAWELREFRLENGALVQDVVARTPDRSFRTAPALAGLKAWIEDPAHELDVNFDRREIPRQLPGGVPLAAAVSRLQPATFGVGSFWELPNVGTAAFPHTRHHFSLNTCEGCHGGETGTEASHVAPTGGFGTDVKLSRFLEGGDIADPRGQLDGAGNVAKRTYADLTRRAQVLACIANGFATPCLCQTTLQKLSMPH